MVDSRNAFSCLASQVFISFLAAPRVLGGSAASTGFFGSRPHLTASLQALCRQVWTWWIVRAERPVLPSFLPVSASFA